MAIVKSFKDPGSRHQNSLGLGFGRPIIAAKMSKIFLVISHKSRP